MTAPTHIMALTGAMDPEMEAIIGLLDVCGIPHAPATVHGTPVHAGVAYRADALAVPDTTSQVWLIECAADVHGCDSVATIDHHRPGDTGYGVPPDNYLTASSIGQVISHIARHDALSALMAEAWYGPEYGSYVRIDSGGACRGDMTMIQACRGDMTTVHGVWHVAIEGRLSGDYDDAWIPIPESIWLIAAADHCLRAAYAGQCPGVDVQQLKAWRIESRASHQQRDPSALMADVDTTMSAMMDAPRLIIGDGYIVDMRGAVYPELVEAGAISGIGYVAGPLTDRHGRSKYTMSGTPYEVRAYMQSNPFGLVDMYGDPARGFAGGYSDV